MRFISTLMVVGTTMAIQSPNLGQSGYVITMQEYAPGDTSCTIPVAITYQPTSVCIAALRQTTNNAFPTVTPTGSILGYTSTYLSYMYTVSNGNNLNAGNANPVFISYFTDASCMIPVTTSQGGVIAADTQVTAQGCTQVGSQTLGSTTNTPVNGGGGFENTVMPMSFSATVPSLGNVPTSVFNTYANNMVTNTYPSCSGIPTQVTIQNIALTQMAPFSSGNTCAKTACAAVTINGQPNGVANPSLATLIGINVNVMGQNLCTVPTVSANNGYYLKNYYTVRNIVCRRCFSFH